MRRLKALSPAALPAANKKRGPSAPGPLFYRGNALRTLRFSRLCRDNSGASSMEWALLASLIAVVCVAVVTAVGLNTLNLYTVICNSIQSAIGGPAC